MQNVSVLVKVLTDEKLYTDVNHINTIEDVYVRPLLKQTETWKEICDLYPKGSDQRSTNEIILNQLLDALEFYEDHKDGLRQ